MRQSSLKSWLQLIRLPNLFTVPGDAMVAILLGGWRVTELRPFWLAGPLAAVLLYAAGLVLNDLMDFEEDLRERPHRPLPSGRIAKPAAWMLFVLLSISALIGLALVGKAAWTIGLLLGLFIALYNVTTKHIPVFGPLTMGLCRGLSVLLGMTMFEDPLRLTYAGAAYFQFIIIYVGLVTMLANYETRSKSPRWLGALPMLALLGGAVALPLGVRDHTLWQDLTFSLLVLLIAWNGFQVARYIFILGRTRPEYIGRLVCLLIPLQAAAMLLSSRPWVGAAWLLLWPVTRWLGKRFYVS